MPLRLRFAVKACSRFREEKSVACGSVTDPPISAKPLDFRLPLWCSNHSVGSFIKIVHKYTPFRHKDANQLPYHHRLVRLAGRSLPPG